MQKMFVANCTRQAQVFFYRLPETKQPRQQTIGIGQQIPVNGEVTTPDVEAILQQYEKYGIVSLAEAKRSDVFAPFVYSLDKPIPSEVIAMMADRHADALQDRGREQRKNAAIVMTNQLGQKAREIGLDLDLEEVRMDVIEDKDSLAGGHRTETGDERIREKVVVTRADRVGKSGRGRNRRDRE